MLILFAFTISLFNLGLDFLFNHTPGFSHLHKYFKPKYDDSKWYILYNPLFGCTMCFSSIYGSIIFLSLHSYLGVPIYAWPIVCIMSIGTTFLLVLIKEKLDQ